MLNAFEARLIALLADAVAGPVAAGAPRIEILARAGGPVADASDVAVTVTLGSAKPWEDFGDDAEVARRVDDVWRLRAEVALTGEAEIALAARTGSAIERRTRLLAALDRLMILLDDARFRHGVGFEQDIDQGFAISGFRLLRLATDPADLADPARARLVYGYKGRFWPVRPEVEGPAITRLPTRIAVLPLRLPERLTMRAGAGAASLGIRGDLRAIGGAQPRLFARLRGLSPGVLSGDGVPAPPGFVSSLADGEGRFALSYAPPAAVAAPLRIEIALSLAADTGTTVPIDDLVVEVVPQ